MEQDDDPMIVFKKKVEDNIRLKYKDAIKTLQDEVLYLRRRQ
jgi:hypothetical protein